MNFNKKIWISALVLSLVLMVTLAACMRSNNEPTTPEVTAAPGANTVTSPTATNAAQNPTVQDTFDWKLRAAAVEKRINMFSELSDSRVVAMDQTALVGIKFANQYKGELTQRIRDMIAGEIMAADPAIQVVAVTVEPGDVATIFNLSEQMQSGGMKEEDLRAQMDAIIKNATTLR